MIGFEHHECQDVLADQASYRVYRGGELAVS
jgi:hypothetical protein